MAAGLFLTDAERARLQAFPTDVSRDDVAAYFTLSRRDLREARSHRGAANRLGFALAIGAIRYLGFVPRPLLAPPPNVMRFVAHQLVIAPDLVLPDEPARARTRHLRRATEHLGFRRAQAKDLTTLHDWTTEQAVAHERPTALLSWAAERLHRQRILRPGVTVLERLVVSARRTAEDQVFKSLQPIIAPNKAVLENLLRADSELGRPRLTWLRERERTSSPRAIQVMLDKHEWIEKAGIADWDLTKVHPNRLRYLARLGHTANPQMMRRMAPRRRFPALVAYLRQALVNITDELIDMFGRCLADVQAKARLQMQAERRQADQVRDEVIIAFQDIAAVLADSDVTDAQIRKRVYAKHTAKHLESLRKACLGPARPLDRDGLNFLKRRYSYIRQFSNRLLRQLDLQSDEGDAPIMGGVQALRDLPHRGRLPPDSPVDFIPKKWRPFVITQDGLDRHYYELCALWGVRGALNEGAAWLPHSRRYAPVSSYIIGSADWKRKRTEAIKELGVPRSAAKALDTKARSLEALEAEARGAALEDLRVEDGEIVIPPPIKAERPASLVELEAAVDHELPRVELCDLLGEVDQWTGFRKHLIHGGEHREPQGAVRQHILAAILAQSSNIGFTRMGTIANMTFEQLAWASTWHMTDATLKDAFVAIVNHHHRQELSATWGGGTLSSSDGQRFPVRGTVPIARALPRYFGYGRGLTFYTWTSDQFSQYGTKVIPTTSRDATYVLDEILDNETELDVMEHTTDTAGYTDLVFGLFDLLGMRFAPRIRDSGATRLYRLEGTADCGWDAMSSARTIKRQAIAEHWDEMLRVAASLKSGHVTASLLVAKIQSNTQTGVGKALVEYGRLCKTEHVLRYLATETYRRRIGTQLNKGEALHALRRFLVFGNLARLGPRDVEALITQASCLNLVTNAVILWNTVYMQRVLNKRRQAGLVVREEDVRHLSPARYEHINPYGKYRFDGIPRAGRYRSLRA